MKRLMKRLMPEQDLRKINKPIADEEYKDVWSGHNRRRKA
jgi:hypothetical protein